LAGLGAALICLGAYTATFTGLPDNPDAEVEYQTTSALARTRSFALGGTPEAQGILAHREGDRVGFDVHEGAGEGAGHWYSWFGVGQALVGVPFHWAGTGLARLFPEVESRHAGTTSYGIPRSEYFAHLLVGWRNPLLGAFTVWLLVLSARRVGASRKSALVAGLAYGLATFAWPQARSTLSDVQATAFLFLALHLILALRERLDRSMAPRRLRLAGAGLALGGAFLTRVVTAPAILVLVIALLAVLVGGRRRTGRAAAVVVDLSFAFVPALACVGLFLWTNYARFGDPLETGYGAAVFSGTFFNHPPLLGLAGLAFAAGKGLFWMAPPLVLAVPGLSRAWKNDDRFLVWVALAFVVAVVAPIAPAETWHGAWTYGPRYVLPLLPVLWLGVALGLDAVADRITSRRFAKGLIALGALTTLPGVLVDHMTHQDLAVQAMRIDWPNAPGETELERDNKRFEAIQWDWSYAAPWAHWRILRHRISGLGEEFPAREIFFVDDAAVLRPAHERERGFRHLAWVDLVQRLGGVAWPGLLIAGLLAAAGLVLAARGFDPAGS